MNPGNPRILTCPHCGGKKKVLSLWSGNTAWMRMWSDNKRVFPYLPQPSFVQKCPHCGGYFLLSRQKEGEYGEYEFCLNEGRLSYAELKEAHEQLSKDLDMTLDERREMLFYLLWGYNDKYWRNEDPANPDESRACENNLLEQSSEKEQVFIEGVVLELLEYVTDLILKAEYLREIGHFEEAALALKDETSEVEFRKKMTMLLEDLISKRDRSVVELTTMIWKLEFNKD